MPVTIDLATCISCGACEGVCPTEAIKVEGEGAVVDTDTCIDCGACVGVCPTEAISQ